jgi:hypothetical protein
MSDEPKAPQFQKPDLKVVLKQDPTDIFNDLAALRKATKPTVQRKKLLLNVEVGRPPNSVHFRTHPELKFEAKVILQKDGTKRIFYYISPFSKMEEHPKLINRYRPVILMLTYMWPGGDILVWPVPEFIDFKVWKSEREAAMLAQEQWMQLAWNDARADYDVTSAENLKLEPQWPEESFETILKVAFSGRIIDNADHEYVKELRGVFDQ